MGAMNPQEIATLRALMEYEAARTAPPAEFPKLPGCRRMPREAVAV
jgi:hypothetical protein